MSLTIVLSTGDFIDDEVFNHIICRICQLWMVQKRPNTNFHVFMLQVRDHFDMVLFVHRFSNVLQE